MKYVYFILLILCFSCGEEKYVELPEISHASIHDVKDISSAYLFYNINEKDSVELNQKNLINSTNWIVNVDKRLNLKQAIPSIKRLQNKKRSAKMHKNEAAKNLYSCNDTSIKNLGFMDFTEVIYHDDIDKKIVENNVFYNVSQFEETNHVLSILFKENDSVAINSASFTKSEFISQLKLMDSIQSKIMGIVYLKFSENLSFQDYITYKSMLSKVKLKHATISNDEYIFH